MLGQLLGHHRLRSPARNINATKQLRAMNLVAPQPEVFNMNMVGLGGLMNVVETPQTMSYSGADFRGG